MGIWALVYTDCPQLTAAVGVTGAGRLLPGAALDALRVGVAADGGGWVEEVHVSPLGLFTATNRVDGSWALPPGGGGSAANTLTLASADVRLRGRRGRGRERGRGRDGGKRRWWWSAAAGAIDVTYLDDAWAVVRSVPGGELYVLRRDGAAEAAAAATAAAAAAAAAAAVEAAAVEAAATEAAEAAAAEAAVAAAAEAAAVKAAAADAAAEAAAAAAAEAAAAQEVAADAAAALAWGRAGEEEVVAAGGVSVRAARWGKAGGRARPAVGNAPRDGGAATRPAVGPLRLARRLWRA